MLRAGTTGALLFVAVFAVDGATRPGYSPARHPVSALSLGGRGWIQITNFVVTGLLMIVFSRGLRRALHPGPGAVWAPRLMAAFGAGLVASGVWVMDPAGGYPPGTPAGLLDGSSWHNGLHDAAGLLVFSALPATAFVLAARFRTSPDQLRWAGCSAATGIAMVGLFVAFGVAWEGASATAGLLQRAAILIGWTWIVLIAEHLALVRADSAAVR